MEIEWVLAAGFGVVSAILGYLGKCVHMELKGMRKDLQRFQIRTENRLSVVETKLNVIRSERQQHG